MNEYIILCNSCNCLLLQSKHIESPAIFSSQLYLILSNKITSVLPSNEPKHNTDGLLIDKNCVYYELFCKNCENSVGKIFLSTNKWLDDLKEKYLIVEKAVKCFLLEESKYLNLKDLLLKFGIEATNYDEIKKNSKMKAKEDENLFIKRSESKKGDQKEEFHDLFDHLKFSLVDMQKGFRLLEKRIEKSEETIDTLITLMNKMIKKK